MPLIFLRFYSNGLGQLKRLHIKPTYNHILSQKQCFILHICYLLIEIIYWTCGKGVFFIATFVNNSLPRNIVEQKEGAQTRRRSESNILHYPPDSCHISHLKKTWYFRTISFNILDLKNRERDPYTRTIFKAEKYFF